MDFLYVYIIIGVVAIVGIVLMVWDAKRTPYGDPAHKEKWDDDK